MAIYETLDYAKKEDFLKIYDIMKNSFPPSEMRNFNDQLSLLDNQFYNILIKHSDDKIVGFLCIWEFSEINFIEHFAIDKEFRGSGIGSKMLEEYLQNTTKEVFLEVEPPLTDLAIRRIEFYKRLGFKQNTFEYFQPALQKGQSPIRLNIMTYPAFVNEEDFNKHKKEVFKIAYGVEIN